jgi:hypothetical protein
MGRQINEEEACQEGQEVRDRASEMRASPRLFCLLLLCGPVAAYSQSDTAKPAPPATAKPGGITAPALENEFFAIIRSGDSQRFLSYVPEDGVDLGRDAQHHTRSEIEDQFTHRSGLYCKLFDSSCIQSTAKLEASAPTCSYRELLTQSEKVRIASTETTRNGVRQAILVAEVHNQKCAGPGLIDFIFNYQQGGWKLFSIP